MLRSKDREAPVKGDVVEVWNFSNFFVRFGSEAFMAFCLGWKLGANAFDLGLGRT